MFVKSDIRKITIAFDKAHQRRVYLALGKAGLVHLARFHEKDSVADGGLQGEEALTREILSATTYVLNALHLEPDERGGGCVVGEPGGGKWGGGDHEYAGGQAAE